MAGAADLDTITLQANPSLEERALLSGWEAEGLAALFKVIANPTRIRLLHALVRGGSRCVTDLADDVGMKPQAVSNQLQRLTDRGIVAPMREGIRVFYRVVDPCVVVLLDRGLCLNEDAREVGR